MKHEASRAEVMALWRLCFEDTEAFTRFYFDAKYQEGNTLVYRDATGEMVAALQMIPYRMTYAGGMIDASYISGACTHPSHRGEGIMKRLLADAFQKMRARGVALSILIPQEPWLFDYYYRQGYVAVFDYRMEEETGEGRRPTGLGVREVRPGEERMEDLYAYFDARMRERGCCVQHDRADFTVIVEDLLSSEGALLGVFSDTGAVVGIAFAEPMEGGVRVKEYSCDSCEGRRALVLALAGRWKGWRQEWRELPSEGPVVHHGMARVVDAGQLLRLYADSHPGERLAIQFTDEMLPENSGIFVLDEGVCHRVERQTGALPVEMDARTLTGWLSRCQPGSAPWMSLMLD
ncbi:MAG: GNAT family N-acetyltransferase [Odoribacteraceae bacterium]|jgi:predicted acetyltransferase|nr:GNAT family N-acetyltransferase [Odoribacteraceae bacterium]